MKTFYSYRAITLSLYSDNKNNDFIIKKNYKFYKKIKNDDDKINLLLNEVNKLLSINERIIKIDFDENLNNTSQTIILKTIIEKREYIK